MIKWKKLGIHNNFATNKELFIVVETVNLKKYVYILIDVIRTIISCNNNYKKYFFFRNISNIS